MSVKKNSKTSAMGEVNLDARVQSLGASVEADSSTIGREDLSALQHKVMIMNEIRVKQAVSRLLLGEDQQVEEVLRGECGGLCFEGILCDIYREEVGGTWLPVEGESHFYLHAEDMSDYTKEDWGGFRAPDVVIQWFGLPRKFVRRMQGFNDSEMDLESLGLLLGRHSRGEPLISL